MERRKYRGAGRKVWTILLALLLVLTMTPAAAFAEEGELVFTYTGDPVTWNYDGSAVTIYKRDIKVNGVDLVTFAQDTENAGVMRNLSVKWTDKTTTQEVQPAEEIGVNDTYHFTGPATAAQPPSPYRTIQTEKAT